MQADERVSPMPFLRSASVAWVLAICAVGGPAAAMEVDHTDRIEEAAEQTGCVIEKIGKGKKKSSAMVYPVTCNADGEPAVRKVACALNQCTFEDDAAAR